ncbi:alkaline shock response membrane anchor protein AmaP [Staphylococcus agnetis]|uniref:alkaline shock response membrane anchor protein AmaP n=1 Tax=Staphylococcus agnetis TaxID=985762 RepID=UPI000CD12BF0|nr:alkaline shock response membrane anchor protein AmaP [Staphylococcus agnetis]MBY7665095.1 alkaline shock response membrane anchor protein AmaP [Staphylococcus agnetis]NJH68450.1 alkaline shock response membrane anchor protein AmaP [Staphylococcus agnetis]NJH80217.1 alkaline shock response membrane anchor protein AmaP [Staphylococcus agnetis]PNY87696.1 alkaline shock response membrane anchor protein AmaP [Staphylococcus agnetis]PTH65948.1 alkaline shock response membrane anchor protein AmaP 
MKRLKNFILGLLIVVIVGFLLFMYIDHQSIKQYQNYFYQFIWFQPLLIGLAGLLILIGLILFFSAFKPTYRKPGLYKDYSDGHIYISRKSFENTVYDTLKQYDDIRQPNVISKLYNKKNHSYIDIKVDYLVPTSTTNVQTLNEKIRNDIKERVEHFAEIPVRTLEINIRDQRKNSNEPRVV